MLDQEAEMDITILVLEEMLPITIVVEEQTQTLMQHQEVQILEVLFKIQDHLKIQEHLEQQIILEQTLQEAHQLRERIRL